VAAAVRELEIPYPVLLDADRGTWQLYANHYWPAKYLADPRGYLRFEHVGEGAYGQTEEWIQELLREAGDTAPMPPILSPLREEDRPGAVCYPATREIYLGWHRGKLIADEGYRPEEDVRHAPRPKPEPPGHFTARGLWHHGAEYLESREPGAELELVCDAVGVNLVAAPAETGEAVEVEVRVLEDGAAGGPAVVHWDRPRMAPLVRGTDFRRWHLVLRFPDPGTRVFTFSFETCVEPPQPS
jgi:hypothetical protein